MFSDLAKDRERASLTVEQAAWRLGLPPAIYRKLESGEAVAELGDVRQDLQAVRLAADVHKEFLQLSA